MLNIAAGCSCIARAAYRRRERLAWTLLGLGIISSGAGFILWAAVYEGQAAPPYPSLADALWLPYYVLLFAAIVALLKAERPHIPATTWLDAVIPACAVSAIASQLLLPHVSTADEPLHTQITLLAIRRWTSCSWWSRCCSSRCGGGSRTRAGVSWRWPCSAPPSVTRSGATWSRPARYHSGSAADLPYVLGAASVALAAWTPRTTDADPAGEDRLTMLLPAVAAMCALGLLLYGALTGDLIAVSLTLAVAAVMAGVVRWLMAVRREAQAAVLRDVAAELARKAEQQATVADLGRQASRPGTSRA